MTPGRQNFLLSLKCDQVVFGVRFSKIEPASGNQTFRRSEWILCDVAWVKNVRKDALANVDEHDQGFDVVVPCDGVRRYAACGPQGLKFAKEFFQILGNRCFRLLCPRHSVTFPSGQFWFWFSPP